MMFDNKQKLLVLVLLVLFVGIAVLVYLKPAWLPSLPNVLPVEETSEDFEEKKSCVGYVPTEGDAIPEPSEPLGSNEVPKPLMTDDEDPTKNNSRPADCFPKDHLDPKDLLPSDATTKWAQTNPTGSGKIGDQNFLNAGYHTGINTVGQTLRNANMQLRSDPPNPQVQVSPWLQTTINPDTNRKPMEIGGCA